MPLSIFNEAISIIFDEGKLRAVAATMDRILR
jgi:hypothetical protein